MGVVIIPSSAGNPGAGYPGIATRIVNLEKEVLRMMYGRGFGMGRGGGFGRGFGFRGYSPPWPYVGLGRGGLPRCGSYAAFGPTPYSPYGMGGYPPPYGEAYASSAGMEPMPPQYPEGPGQQTPYPPAGGFGAPGMSPFGPPMTPEQEIDFLKGQAQMLKEQLDQIDGRLGELEKLR